MIPPPTGTVVEHSISNGVEWLRLVVETTGALIIAAGLILAVSKLIRGPRGTAFHSVRLTLASHLALALEFQLAADILSTAIAPTWDKIGKLAAIAVIRTALNFFLMHEIALDQAATGRHPLKEGPPNRIERS